MIFEFIGSPGVGKTSVCSRVMKELASNGYIVRNLDRDECKKNLLYRRVEYVRAAFGMSTRGLRRVLHRYDSILKERNSVWVKFLLKSVVKIEERYAKKCDMIFFEEGPTQYMTSIFHMMKVDEQIDPLIDELNRSFYDHDVIAFYLYADPDDITDRIRNRNRKKDRFLREDPEEMRSMLEIKVYNLEYIIKKIQYRRLYRIENRDLDETISQVLSTIRELKGNEA